MAAISDGSHSHDHCIVEDFRSDTSWMPGDVKRGLLDPVKKLEHAMETCSLTQGHHNNQTQHTDQASKPIASRLNDSKNHDDGQCHGDCLTMMRQEQQQSQSQQLQHNNRTCRIHTIIKYNRIPEEKQSLDSIEQVK